MKVYEQSKFAQTRGGKNSIRSNVFDYQQSNENRMSKYSPLSPLEHIKTI